MKQEFDNLRLHIVSFAIPYPADYGGVQDVFHKLRWLKKLGVKVHLHVWAYHGRLIQPELAELCEQISVYDRRINWKDMFMGLPYTIASRNPAELLANLKKDDAPILFESLHATRQIAHPDLASRKLIFRESNIEHDYYRHLATHETHLFKQLYFKEEARRLKRWEPQLKHAAVFCNVSEEDQRYFRTQFPQAIHEWIPSFTPYDNLKIGAGGGAFALYHGNLSIQENAVTAHMLARLWNSNHQLPPLVIAGKQPDKTLRLFASHRVQILADPSDGQLDDLITTAGWHLMFTPQPTGIKLKFLNVLFQGGRIIANPHMVHGTGLSQAVSLLEDWSKLPDYMLKINPGLSNGEWENRQHLLRPFFNKEKALRIVELVK